MAVKKKLDAMPRRRKRSKGSKFGASCPPGKRHKVSKPGGRKKGGK